MAEQTYALETHSDTEVGSELFGACTRVANQHEPRDHPYWLASDQAFCDQECSAVPDREGRETVG